MTTNSFARVAAALLISAAALLGAPVGAARSEPLQDKSSSGQSAAEPRHELHVHGYPKDIPLAEAVDEFNKRAQGTPTGKTQPPLKVSEVLAAIRDWSPQIDHIEDAMFQKLQRAAHDGMLPKGSFLSLSLGSVARNGYDIESWQIILQVGLDKYPSDLADQPSYAKLIRLQYVSSGITRTQIAH